MKQITVLVLYKYTWTVMMFEFKSSCKHSKPLLLGHYRNHMIKYEIYGEDHFIYCINYV